MKKQHLIIPFSTIALCVWVVGCNQQSTSPSSDSEAKPGAASGSGVEKAKEAVNNTIEAAQQTGEKVMADAKAAGSNAIESVNAKAGQFTDAANTEGQKLIDSAKSLISDGKFSEALATLEQTTGLSLTEAQKETVDKLKQQVEDALSKFSNSTTEASEAAKNAINNLMKK